MTRRRGGLTQETATNRRGRSRACAPPHTLWFSSLTLCVWTIYIFKSAPVVPLSPSASAFLWQVLPKSQAHAANLHLAFPNPAPLTSISLSLLLLHALRSCGLCPAAHCSLHARVWGGSEGRVGLDRFLELLYDKSGLSSACLQCIRSKPSHFEQYQTNCLLWAHVHASLFAFAPRHPSVFSHLQSVL